MDTTQPRSTVFSAALAVMVAATLAASGCAHEEHPIGQPAVRVAEQRRELVASAKILRNGEEVGALRTLRVHGQGQDRVLHQVQDLHMNSLGYIDEQNCAWRLTAHTGSELVSNSSDQRRNVAAILGAFNSSIEIVEEQAAATLEKDRQPAPGRTGSR
jgi:hypothetical protein